MISCKIHSDLYKRINERLQAIQKNKETMMYLQYRRTLNVKEALVNLDFSEDCNDRQNESTQ